MDYFDGIEWVTFNHAPHCRQRFAKQYTDYYVVNYNHSGRVELRMGEGDPITINGPAVWFAFPGLYLRFQPVGSGSWDHRHIGFRGPRVDRWLRGGLLSFAPQRPVLSISRPDLVAAQMDELVEYLSFPVYGPAHAVYRMEGLLLELQKQHIKSSPMSPTEQRVAAWLAQNQSRGDAQPNLRAAAGELGLSYSHFRVTVRRLTGHPPATYLRHRRMERAVSLLRQRDPPIKDIALEVGYGDVFSFSKVFKRHFNSSPAAFRRRALH